MTIRSVAMVPLLFGALFARSAEPNKGKGFSMDYGPVLASSIAVRGSGKEQTVLAYKSLDIKLGDGAWVSFDTDLLRYAAGWTGEGLGLLKTHMTSEKGDVCVGIAGKLVFSTKMAPGVSHHGSLDDPRNNPLCPQRGPLPKEHAHYKGLYLNGDRVVLAYSAGGGEILELPGAVKVGDRMLFTRTLRVEKTTEPLTFVLADDSGALSAAIVGGPEGTKFFNADAGLRLTLPAIEKSTVFTIVLGEVDDVNKSLPTFPDPADLLHGGPPRWKDFIETHGQLSVSPKSPADAPYVVDTLPLPEKNPWNAWIRPTGVDFFADGKSAAICTWSGDVWIVSGLDDSLPHLTWKRFATGLYEPLGLKIVNDTIYTLGRDQITRLRDLNGDGEADFYENFNNDGLTGDQYHLFKYDLDTDPAGNFYYAVGGNWATSDIFYGHAVLCKVPRDGSKLEYLSRGFRAPNGLAVGPGGEIVTGDNQGYWMPSSKINYIPPGKTDGFYGFPFEPRIAKTFDVKKFFPNGIPKTFDPPLCWIPYSLDNSSGGQVFITTNEWGPFKGHILHTSYGKSALFMVMHELIDGGVPQGGVWRFPLAFEGGIMRARFNPADGQLYVCGMRGWQTNSAKDGCLQRVRYTGKPVYQTKELHTTAKGISIEFTCPLDPATANDAGSYDVEQWNYQWSAQYGSPELSVVNPTKKGRDTVEVTSAKLQPDGRTVFLEMPSIAPVMQMAITYKLKSADGHDVEGAVYNTINAVPAARP